MGQFDVDISALHRGRTVVSETHEAIRAETTKVGESIESMLAGSWTGPAATDYAAGWREWQEGAKEVLDALDLMGQAMAETLAEYVERDTHHAQALSRVRSHLPDQSARLNL